MTPCFCQHVCSCTSFPTSSSVYNKMFCTFRLTGYVNRKRIPPPRTKETLARNPYQLAVTLSFLSMTHDASPFVARLGFLGISTERGFATAEPDDDELL